MADSISFIPVIDPRFFKGGDATDHLCEGCGMRPACHVHHKEFKKMGGRHGVARKQSERPENKIELCITCHDATHIRHTFTLDGFSCEQCPKLYRCFYGSRLLGHSYQHLTPWW